MRQKTGCGRINGPKIPQKRNCQQHEQTKRKRKGQLSLPFGNVRPLTTRNKTTAAAIPA